MNPTLRVLSLGAGVQSTALALMAAYGELEPLDAAIFADTGWEPQRVYDHLDRLAAVLAQAGVPLHRVSNGNLRDDAINPEHRYASIPYFVLNPPDRRPVHAPCPEGCEWSRLDAADLVRLGDDLPTTCPTCNNNGRVTTAWRDATPSEREGMGRRQCTSEYKLSPVRRKVRELLGAPVPDFRRVPRGRVAEVWIGFSTDEIGRVNDNPRDGVLYERKRHPLLDLGMSRSDCSRWLRARGWTSVEKSACIGCPFHGNRQWRELRDEHPEEWADAVAFDVAIRKGGSRGLPLDGQAFLHRSRVPLDIAPIDRVTRAEWRDRQGDLFELAADDEVDESGDPDGCSPWGCRSGESVA